jgi:hypothetical protein
VREVVEVREFLISMMGPVIGAHVGPGCIAMFFEADMDRPEYEAKFYPANAAMQNAECRMQNYYV